MASQNIARLGVVLGIDTAEFTAGIDKAISEQKKLKAAITRESNAAAKEIIALKYATEDYGKSLTKTEQIQREFIVGGRYANATKELKDQLLAQAKAYDQVAASAQKAGKAQMMGMLGAQGNKLNPQQLSALGYQTTDIITGLAGGQNPLLVLIQQGGQLRDQFGGVTNVFKAFASVLTPMRLLLGGIGAGLGVVAYGFYKGSEEAAKFRDTLILTNNAAGLTVSSFEALTKNLANSMNLGIRDARDILMQLASTGKFTASSMIPLSEVIAKISKLSGEDVNNVAKNLIASFDGTAASAKKLNEQYNFLNPAQYRQIELLEQQNKRQEAITFTSKALLKSLEDQTRELGALERALSATSRAWQQFKDLIFSIGRDNPEDKLARLKEAIEDAIKMPAFTDAQKKARDKFIVDALKQYDELSRELAKKKAEADKKSEQADANQAALRQQNLKQEQDFAFDYRKKMSEAGFQDALNGSAEFERIQIQGLQKIAELSLKYEKETLQAGGAYQQQRLKLLLADINAVEKEIAQKQAEVSRLRYREIELRQTADENSVIKEREKLELYKQNIFLSDSDYQIALDRLKTEQEIAKIMSDQRLTDKAKEELSDRETRIQNQREEVIKLGESLKVLKDINQAVFRNMSDAIAQFILTGKANFRSFAGSVIQEILRIQAAALAAQASRGIMSVVGSLVSSAFTSGISLGSQPLGNGTTSGFGINPSSSGGFRLRAGGGDIRGGEPVIVGDAGPELFMPRNAGTIVPNSQLAGAMSSGNVVNNYYIDAIDTKSFEDRVLGSSNAVWAANQYANKSLAVGRGRV